MKHTDTLRRLMRFIGPYKIYLVLALISSALNIVFTLMTPIFIGYAIDAMVGVGQVNFALLFKRVIMIAISAAGAALFNYLLTRFSNRMTFEITRDIRDALFEKYQALPLSYIDSHAHGDLMSRMIADIDLISDGLLQGFTNLFGGWRRFSARSALCGPSMSKSP